MRLDSIIQLADCTGDRFLQWTHTHDRLPLWYYRFSPCIATCISQVNCHMILHRQMIYAMPEVMSISNEQETEFPFPHCGMWGDNVHMDKRRSGRIGYII